ncbi:alpha/beta fold hydrolase [Phenylobacterium montanum]|uniref:Alpha/beta fold hydrolase n=1 Tax=Phenylobacterium montanum TaxID=2823693 RepID=A0A975ITC2_9CAUL|nr:alpha/beta fold hydrolase [Caulobacter sp. S6]QUD86628.1 alpha/beta fold hydrolase [Caulobacter sp. S6]
MQLKIVQTHHTPVHYLEAGSGTPLVYLHGAGGLTAEDPLLIKLAERHHVFAPYLPGYGPSDECHALRDMLDFTLHGWDVVEALGLKDPILVGHSMGGMIAAEMAAVAPNDLSRLALICPAGLWLDDHPIPDIFATLPFEMPGLLFHDPERGRAMMTSGLAVDDPAFLQTYLVTNARQLGMAGRILFPIPERGLSQRLYRIKAETALIWGDSDRLIPPVYAHAFKQRIEHCRLTSIPEAGHMVGWEKTAEVAAAIERLGPSR